MVLRQEIEWHDDVLRVCEERGKIYAQIGNAAKHLVATHAQKFELIDWTAKQVLIKWESGTVTRLDISGVAIAVT